MGWTGRAPTYPAPSRLIPFAVRVDENVMSAPPVEPADLLDLKLLPAWLKESDAKNYFEHYKGEEEVAEPRGR
ncbi:MAG TPA: hypothetical protein VE131_08510, partial [Terriglobales bacterium]|nr:hypothetical protein [Terriglobales bacterium]